MALVVESIGVGQDFTTLTLWEADLANKNSVDDIIGEMINQVFDETFTMNDSTPTSITLSVESSNRHDGTEGTGARIVRTGGGGIAVSTPNNFTYLIEWFEFDMNGNNGPMFSCNGASADDVSSLQRLIIHGSNGGNSHRGFIQANTRDVQAMNNICYDISDTSSTVQGIWVDGDRVGGGVINNTVFGIDNPSANNVNAIQLEVDNANGICKNNISAGHTSDSGTANDFVFAGSSNLDSDHNLSEDATADDGGGSNNVINATTIDFVSTVGGSEDLHVNSESSEAHAAGEDLVLTPSGVEIDIDGTDRNADGGAWDIGAHQFVSLAGGGQVWPSRAKQMAHLLNR